MNITTNINLPNYSIEFTQTELHDEGTLLHINNNSLKPKKDLNIYKSHELKSTFIEIVNPNKFLKKLLV